MKIIGYLLTYKVNQSGNVWMLRFDTKAQAQARAQAEAEAEEEEPSEAAGLESETIKDAGSTGMSAPVFTGSSTPASAMTKPAKAKKISEKIPPANQPADLMKDGFEDTSGKPSSGLFKLGEIPTDEKGGFHIDAGTSVLNALKSPVLGKNFA